MSVKYQKLIGPARLSFKVLYRALHRALCRALYRELCTKLYIELYVKPYVKLYMSYVYILLSQKPCNLGIQLDVQHSQQHHRLQLHLIGCSFHYRLLAISILSGNNLLKPMTNFLANNTYLKTPYLTTLLSTSLSTTIPSTEYTMVSSLEEERARKQDKRA